MDTATLRNWDVNHVWHPFTPMQEFATEETPIIVSGEGFDLIDSDGKRYLDGISALWCNVHGFRVPEIDAAIREQLDCVGHSTLLGRITRTHTAYHRKANKFQIRHNAVQAQSPKA